MISAWVGFGWGWFFTLSGFRVGVENYLTLGGFGLRLIWACVGLGLRTISILDYLSGLEEEEEEDGRFVLGWVWHWRPYDLRLLKGFAAKDFSVFTDLSLLEEVEEEDPSHMFDSESRLDPTGPDSGFKSALLNTSQIIFDNGEKSSRMKDSSRDLSFQCSRIRKTK